MFLPKLSEPWRNSQYFLLFFQAEMNHEVFLLIFTSKSFVSESLLLSFECKSKTSSASTAAGVACQLSSLHLVRSV